MSKKWHLGPDHLGSYMRRWLFRTPWFTIRVHKIQESDSGRDFHDHPFKFTSLILSGGYIEHVPGCLCWIENGQTLTMSESGPCNVYLPGDVVKRDALDFHRLELFLEGESAWTFVVTGPYEREWGFLEKDGSWAHSDEYRLRYNRGVSHP